MSCEDCQSSLIDYHYGELAESQREALAGHLGACGACATEYCRLHAALSEVARAGSAAPSDALRTRLRAEVARRFTTPRQKARARSLLDWLRRPVPLYQVAALLGLFVGGAALIATLGNTRDLSKPRARPAQIRTPLIPTYDAPRLGAVSDNLL